MKLEGIHHVTAITADAPGNVDFYTRVLGLRLVKKTVNQDDPTVYHLFYADELGSPGADLTFFEYPGLPAAARAPGWCTRSRFRVASDEALAFWAIGSPRRGSRRSGAGAASSSPIPRDGPRDQRGRDGRRAARRPVPRDPAGAGAPGVRRRARVLGRPGQEP